MFARLQNITARAIVKSAISKCTIIPKISINTPVYRSLSIKLNSVKTESVPESKSCCNHKGEHDHSCNSTPTPVSAEPAPKKVCDPYGQEGLALDTSAVNMQMLSLSSAWTYNEEKKILSRAFKFTSMHKGGAGAAPASKPVKMEGFPSGPRTGPGACFVFMQVVNNLCTNCDHWVYNITATPRKSEVNVELKTIIRGGLTNADFYLAMHMDAMMATQFRQ